MKKSLNFCKSKNGFTLVELVIVIAIVIILSVISVPIYRAYVNKAKWTEGYALLSTILSAQKAYYSEHGNFLRAQEGGGDTAYNPILGIDVRGNKYFTWFRAGCESADPKIQFWSVASKPEELIVDRYSYFELYYSIESGATYRKMDF